MGMAAILVMWPGPFEQQFPHPMETPYEIWLQSAWWFLRRCLKSVDDGQTNNEACLSISPVSLHLRWAKKVIYLQP